MPAAWKRLYLRDGVPTINPGTLELSNTLPVGAGKDFALSPAILSPIKGTSTVTYSGASLAQVAHQDNFFTSFSTPPLMAQSVNAGTWSFAIECQEQSTQANSFFALSLYLYRPSGSTVATYIYDSDTALATEWGGLEHGRGATFSGASFTSQSGDILVLEVWRHAAQDVATAFTQQIFLDGGTDVSDGDTTFDAASWIEAPQEIGFSPRLRLISVG